MASSGGIRTSSMTNPSPVTSASRGPLASTRWAAASIRWTAAMNPGCERSPGNRRYADRPIESCRPMFAGDTLSVWRRVHRATITAAATPAPSPTASQNILRMAGGGLLLAPEAPDGPAGAGGERRDLDQRVVHGLLHHRRDPLRRAGDPPGRLHDRIHPVELLVHGGHRDLDLAQQRDRLVTDAVDERLRALQHGRGHP